MCNRYTYGLYDTLRAAQDAAVDDYLTASGRQEPGAAVEPGDTPESIAADMIAAGWTVPGITTSPGDPEREKLADLVRDRLEKHGVLAGLRG